MKISVQTHITEELSNSVISVKHVVILDLLYLWIIWLTAYDDCLNHSSLTSFLWVWQMLILGFVQWILWLFSHCFAARILYLLSRNKFHWNLWFSLLSEWLYVRWCYSRNLICFQSHLIIQNSGSCGSTTAGRPDVPPPKYEPRKIKSKSNIESISLVLLNSFVKFGQGSQC